MHEFHGKGWKHPGRRSSDYSLSSFNDHDHRTYAGAESHYGQGPKGYNRPDESIKEEVCELLFWDPDVDATDIEVQVQNNCVFLNGSVDSRHAKKMAETVIENVSGVHDVFNNLKIRPLLDIDSDKLITRGDEGLFTEEVLQK
ncbi:MAG: BON domain-containing protein [Bacteriovoracia bacterium]